jgi:Icc-related predicted phosphoesterase
MRILAVSDEVEGSLWRADVRRRTDPDLVLACGDLPLDYLGFLAEALDVPVVFVPGNHDPDLSGYRRARSGLMMRGGIPTEAPWPCGTENADGRVVDVCGLRIAGLGGCLRYRAGPNQYTEWQQALRAARLGARAQWRRARDGRGVDVLITHAPPAGVGDGEDRPHHGFATYHRLVRRLRTPLLLHGHVHPHGQPRRDHDMQGTAVCNVVGHRIMEITPGAAPVPDGAGR